MEVIGDLDKICEEKCLITVDGRNIGKGITETMSIDNSFEEFSEERSKKNGIVSGEGSVFS